MFYRPHFCCHCGEKIIREKWTPLTSRRFCEFCAIEQKQHDLVPRAAAVAIILFGAAGLTAYLTGSGGGALHDGAASAKLLTQKRDQQATANNAKTVNSDQPGASSSAPEQMVSNTAAVNTKQRAPQRNSSTEPVYYCGAMTKKGTACTRRVKTPGRCWQHLGQPAMAPVRN